MFNKIYVFLKENRKEIIIVLAIFIIFNIKFPYYIDSPGGTLSLKEKFIIEDAHSLNGDISLVYVAEREATIPSLLISFILDDWDIIKREEVAFENESNHDVDIRGRITLKGSFINATIYALKKASKEVEILDTKIYVIYVLPEAKTDIKVGDQLRSINGFKIESKDDIFNVLENFEVGEEIEIEVLNDGKKEKRHASIISIDGVKKIGIALETIYDYKSENKIEYVVKNTEQGSSGGFVNALYIYASLIDEDILKGRKIVGTGTLDEDGIVGPIGGVKYKLKAAEDADLFFIAQDNCEEATKIKEEKKYKFDLVCIKDFDEAIEYLKGN